MSEDYHDKTEDPTPKRLSEARKKGYVAKSQDLIVSFHLIMCMIVFFFFVDQMFSALASININIFNNLNMQFADLYFITEVVRSGLIQLLFILIPLIAGGFFVSILFNILQTGMVFSFYPLVPKWNKLNIFNPSNYERIFGIPTFVKLAFGLIRLQLVLILCVGVVGQNAFHVFALGKVPIQEMVAFIKRESILVGFSIAMSYLVIALCDFFYQKWLFTRKMRMSKREVKDEIKQGEGDQNIKNKIRALMRLKTEEHIINDLSKADILIVEGNQFAVAVSYKQKEYTVPFCIEKGRGQKAIVMLEIAKTHSISVVENPILAQKLYREVEVGTYIKTEYYHDIIMAITLEERNS